MDLNSFFRSSCDDENDSDKDDIFMELLTRTKP